VQPGERATINFWLELPEGSGNWDLSLSFVEQNVAWFEQHGAAPLAATIRRIAPISTVGRDRLALMRHGNPSFHAPSQGVPRSRNGRPYPNLIKVAAGARVRDREDNEWLDYAMGSGSALLGYAHPEIGKAIANQFNRGGALSLAHEVEAAVTGQLIELIPSAEQAVFGKNGSDVCSAAVRAGRLATGRRVVLFSGDHGWQEPFASVAEPALACPDGPNEAFRFSLNDTDGFRQLVSVHAGRIATVMVEPAAQVEGIDGPVRDADADILRHVAQTCRAEGAILIFNEIMTGFRHPSGSVQQATGVVPDLACFGKALAGGMPLSALVGRADLLRPLMSRLFYHPTFQGEACAFAAALRALEIYRLEDVPARIQLFGNQLMAGVDRISEELGVEGQMAGLPYRMVYRFNEPDAGRRAQMRTLLQQFLLQEGILTFRGFMLPSLAHGDKELDETLVAFRRALARVQHVAAAGSFVSELEIPLVL
jgi:glutamate-1-semialdehyde 2,1-aminomutase